VAAIVLLLAVAWGFGCDKAPPPVTDPANAPWVDPKAQLKSLKESDYRIRGLAAFHLGNMGAKATEAIPELERIARDDPNEKVRANAQEALAKIRAASQ
jgi:hypothetical protein